MQPTIRQYYNLEEIWGEKPVRSKLGAVKPAATKTVIVKASSKSSKAPAKKTASKVASTKTSAKKAPAKKTATRQR